MRPLLRSLCGLAAALLSCGAPPREAPRSAAAVDLTPPDVPALPAGAALPDAPPSAPAEPPPSLPEPASPPFVAAPLPAALFELRTDAETLFPERAKLIGTDALSLAPRESAYGVHGPMLWELPVIEAHDSVYRILCITRGARLAVFAPADALSTLARRLTPLTATARVGAATPPQDAVFLGAGARVQVLGDAPDERPRTYHRGHFLESEGYADRRDLGKTFTPAELPRDPVLNGELVTNGPVFDGPNGAVLATITRPPHVGNRMFVHILSKPEQGFRRIRYEEMDAYVVGWVPAASLSELPMWKVGAGGSMSGFGTGRPPNPIRLAAGTRLRSAVSHGGEALGVLLADDEHECTAQCASNTPIVRIHLCGTTFELRAEGAAMAP